MIKHDSKGFTLMEVMIAMAIFAIGILGVAKLQITATSDNTTSRTITEGANMAVGGTEKLINLAYDDIATHTPTVVNAASGVNYTVTNTINNHAKGIKQINVTTEWKDKSNSKRSCEIVTYKSEAAQ